MKAVILWGEHSRLEGRLAGGKFRTRAEFESKGWFGKLNLWTLRISARGLFPAETAAANANTHHSHTEPSESTWLLKGGQIHVFG